jgi:hypothetical protein
VDRAFLATAGRYRDHFSPHRFSCPQLHKAIVCYIIDRAIWGKGRTDVKANGRYIRIQVRSPLFGLCRIQLGIASEAFPLQDATISIERHSCQTLDGEAFRANRGLARKSTETRYALGDVEAASAIGFGPGDFDSCIRVLPS